MYALAINGELVLARVQKREVLEALKDREEAERVEIASFEKGKGWIPVCLESLTLRAN